MDSIRKRVKTFIIRNRMLDPGDLVLVGLSGGPDSVFLLYILKELSGELGISVSAVHVHHGIRGAEADRDLAFTRELAQRMEIPFREYRVDAPSWSAASGQSLEEAARELRYAFLERAAAELNCDLIATAHTVHVVAKAFQATADKVGDVLLVLSQ